MSDETRALTPQEALRRLIESADFYEAEARGSHVWDEGGSTETIVRGIQQYRPTLTAEPQIVHTHGPSDGAGTACPEHLIGECVLIAERTRYAALVERIIVIHRRIETERRVHDDGHVTDFGCAECGTAWPCATIAVQEAIK